MLAAMKRKYPQLTSSSSSGNEELSQKARAFSVQNLINGESSSEKVDEKSNQSSVNDPSCSQSTETISKTDISSGSSSNLKNDADSKTTYSSEPTESESAENPCSSQTQLPKCESSRSSPELINQNPIQTIGDITMELYNNNLWDQFHELGTEMIITKAGRRMFPSIKIKINGLEPESNYTILVEMVPRDDKKYRYVYHSSQWVVAGQGDPPLSGSSTYVHPDSPTSGKYWQKHGGLIAFDKLKLTNNKHPGMSGQISLHSMHKYQPVIHVIKMQIVCNDPHSVVLPISNSQSSISFIFKQTNFITVTAYQNQQITLLKITSNPFAKGFRENSKMRTSKCQRLSKSNSVTGKEVPNSTSCLPTSLQMLGQSAIFPPPYIFHPLGFNFYAPGDCLTRPRTTFIPPVPYMPVDFSTASHSRNWLPAPNHRMIMSPRSHLDAIVASPSVHSSIIGNYANDNRNNGATASNSLPSASIQQSLNPHTPYQYTSFPYRMD